MTLFHAQIPDERLSAVTVTKSPMMVFVSDNQNQSVQWANKNTPEGQSDSGFRVRQCLTDNSLGFLSNMNLFGGKLYVTDQYGSIISTNIEFEKSPCTIKMVKAIAGLAFLENSLELCSLYHVLSENELLLVISGRIAKGRPIV
jgi:hypothetical protein